MFDTLISDTQTFLRTLERNNSRDWFLAHKSEFDENLSDPTNALVTAITPHLTALTDLPVKGKQFRIHRDVRFSKDKTPYKTHRHMLWTVQTGTRQDPVFFLGIHTDRIIVGTGMMEFTKDVLVDWRKMADLDGAYLIDKIKSVTDKSYELGEPKLKRIPSPFSKDHAHGDLLRHKGLVVRGELTPSGDLVDDITRAFTELWPVSDMLIGVAETPTI